MDDEMTAHGLHGNFRSPDYLASGAGTQRADFPV
jgi:hypothetical protein